jgi:hypothetical protein
MILLARAPAQPAEKQIRILFIKTGPFLFKWGMLKLTPGKLVERPAKVNHEKRTPCSLWNPYSPRRHRQYPQESGRTLQNQAPAGSMGPGRRRNRHWLLQGEVQAVMMYDYRPTEF